MRLAKHQTSIEQGLMIDLQVMVYIIVQRHRNSGECKIISQAASVLGFVIVQNVNVALSEGQCLAFNRMLLLKAL